MIGSIVGGYRIVSKVGEGGMGSVYLAEHSLIGRRAAIKTLLPELSRREDIVGRFFDEARAASAVHHPGIVQLYDFGLQPNGTAYIAMEFLGGESLRARLRRVGRLPLGEALDLARQIAAALAAAHDTGVIHRDLKPPNIILVPDPEIGERIKIVDFGLAKLTSGDLLSSQKTCTGIIMGTPAYMSPEQCRGGGEIDHRTDLYSLGCLLFEMLCGRPPFIGEGGGAVLGAHMYESPPSLLDFEPLIPPTVDTVVQRLLAKRPEDRYATASELLYALPAIPASMADSGGYENLSVSRRIGAVNGPAPSLQPICMGLPASPARKRVHRVVLAAGGMAAAGVLLFALHGSSGPQQQAPEPVPMAESAQQFALPVVFALLDGLLAAGDSPRSHEVQVRAGQGHGMTQLLRRWTGWDKKLNEDLLEAGEPVDPFARGIRVGR